MMPAVLEVTEPEPCVMTLSANCPVATGVNVAVTLLAAFIATTQVPVPVQPAPLQPVNWKPVAGVAASVTFVPALNPSVQSVGHVMPPGEDPTLPEPVTTAVKV